MSGEFDNNYSDSSYGSPQPNGDGSKGMAIAAMVLGIVSIVLSCIWYVSLVTGIIGIVLGIMYNKKNGKCGMSTAGIVCSIIGMVLAVVIIILGILGLAALGGLAAYEGL